MVKSFLVFVILCSSAQANIFDFGGDKSERGSKITIHLEKLKKLQMKDDPQYEEDFNQSIKALENAVEEEKLYCSGEASDSEGKILPPAQKQLCMRELKKYYLEAQSTIFDLKKKYLALIHQRQIQKLTEIQKKLQADIEKNF